MQVTCRAKTKSGRKCQAPADKKTGFCLFHDPKKARARAAGRKQGGRTRLAPKPSKGQPAPVIATAEDILRLVNLTVADLWSLENTCPRARALLTAASEAAKVLSAGEVEDRLRAIEERIGE